MNPVPHVLQVIADSQPGASGEQRPFYEYLESCLRHKAEMVIFEAARAICNLKDVTARELTPAITVLQLFLSSSKPVLRFAAVRTLNKVGWCQGAGHKQVFLMGGGTAVLAVEGGVGAMVISTGVHCLRAAG